MNESEFQLFVALLHYPVVDRNKQIVTASVTNFDLHDIARTCRTFGIKKYFVVHPSPDEQALNQRIVSHWKSGYGLKAHPTRALALENLVLASNFDEVIEGVRAITKADPLLIGTSARASGHNVLSPSELVRKMRDRPVLLVFGTGYGLSESWQKRLDHFLKPIEGSDTYNHLSVRSAVAIYLDRIFQEATGGST